MTPLPPRLIAPIEQGFGASIERTTLAIRRPASMCALASSMRSGARQHPRSAYQRTTGQFSGQTVLAKGFARLRGGNTVRPSRKAS